MIDPLGTMANTAVLAATGQSAFSMLFSRDLHVFLLPQPMDSLTIHQPAISDKLLMDSGIAKPGSLSRQPSHLAQ